MNLLYVHYNLLIIFDQKNNIKMPSVLTKKNQSSQQGGNLDQMFKKMSDLRQLKEDGNKYLQFMLDYLHSVRMKSISYGTKKGKIM